MDAEFQEIYKIQRKYFQILDEIFKRIIGCDYRTFCRINEFDEAIKKIPLGKVPQMWKKLQWAYEELTNYYAQRRTSLYSLSRKCGGNKLVLGGGSRFTLSHFNSVRKMLLYSDTIYVPDPLLPWVEVFRVEEAFRDIHFLKAVFITLHLKPLVDANLPCPAVVVFPGWEKTLETSDGYTRSMIRTLTKNFIWHFFRKHVKSYEMMRQYIAANQASFLKIVEEKNLFIVPGEIATGDISKAIASYKNYIRTWRSPAFAKGMLKLSDAAIVLIGIQERIIPQFHLMDNAESLDCQPMMCHDVDWHYYVLCSQLHEERLRNMQLLRPDTISILRSLNSEKFKWLGNVPIDVLVTLRENNQNELFRRKLNTYVRELHEAKIGDIDKVTKEVAKAISSLLNEHQTEIKKIQDKYNKKHRQTLAATILTAAALFVPTLAPYIGGVAPFALATKYFWDKSEELHKKKAAAKSLTGILAKAAES